MRVDRKGSCRHSNLILVNTRSTAWEDDRGQYWADGHLFDLGTQEEIALGEYGIAGTGGAYHLEPRGSVEIRVAMGSLVQVPPGRYGIVACLQELALGSPLGTLEIGS
jgi:hypothetical protein